MGFSGLNIGLSSLLAQRRAIEITGHNLSNVGTDGYSRQRVDMVSDTGPITPALFATYNGTGNGVKAGSITRMRDQFLELRGYQEHAADTHTRTYATSYDRIERIFAEPSDTALAAQLGDYWAGWDDVANRPDDPAARSQLLARATTLASSIQRMDNDLRAMQQDSLEQVKAIVLDVNSTAARIAELNGTIQNAVNANLNANDLMDQRDRLISQLAEQVGVTVRPGESGTMHVFIEGTAIVRGTSAEKLEVSAGPPAAVTWAKDGQPANVTGTTGGLLDTVNTIVPQYRQALAEVAFSVRDETNALHQTGHGLDGTTGIDFFVDDPSTGLIKVNDVLTGNPDAIGASATPGTLDGSIAAKIAASTGTDARYREVVVALGVESQSAARRVAIQSAITQQVDKARESEAGVNLDEEMTNLIAYQHAYNAAARFVSAVDETLDVLINLGR